MSSSDITNLHNFKDFLIESLNLSPEAYEPLVQGGIRTLGDLVSPSELQIEGVRSFGVSKTIVKEIKSKYASFKRQFQKGPDVGRKYKHQDQIKVPEKKNQVRSIAESDLDKIPLETLDVSADTREAFVIRGIFTIGELSRLTDKEFTRIAIEAGLDYHVVRKVRDDLSLYQALYLTLSSLENLDSFREQPLDNLNLSQRGYNGLARVGITTIDQLLDLSEIQLLDINNLGELSVKDIKEKLSLFLESGNNLDDVREEEGLGKEPSPVSEDVAIDVLDLKPRTLNALIRANIKTVAELAIQSENQLSAIRQIGLASINEIRQALQVYDLPHSQLEALGSDEETTVTEHEGTASLLQDPHNVKTEIISIPRALKGWLASLSDKERKVISSRYGFSGEPRTLQKIGEEMSLSRERIRRIVASAIDKLQLPINYPHVSQLQEEVVQALFDHGGVLTNKELCIHLEEQGVSLGSVNQTAFLILFAATNKEWTFNRKYGLAVLSFLPVTDIPKLHQDFVEILTELQKPVFIDQLIGELRREVMSTRALAPRYFLAACARTCPYLDQINGKFVLKTWRREQLVELEEPAVSQTKSKPQREEKPIEPKELQVSPPKTKPLREEKPVKQRPKQPTTVFTKPTIPIDDIDSGNPFYELEKKLLEGLENVDFIGELLIDRHNYNQLCQAIQGKAVRNSRAFVNLVPNALFAISMVFTARYSDENARNFWAPYARLVWGFEEASQSFQNRCRRRFRQTSNYFEDAYGFSFPRHSEGDVVRPVYRHAIIPYYLQDDFAEWLQRNWREILELGFTPESSESLVPLLRSDKSVEHLPPTLRGFIQGSETADTAAALIINMAMAANLFAEGESAEDISDLLAANPIEQALWSELAKVYAEQADAVASRISVWKPQWVWSFEDHEMRLRLQNVTIAAGPAPHQLVWVALGEDPLLADVSEYIDPWELESGEWWIDDATIADGPMPGKLVLITESNALVGSAEVSQLTTQEVLIFRATQQGVYGIPVDYTNRMLVSGDWFLSLADGASILDEAGNEIMPKELLPVPSPLDQVANHRIAGRYRLKLPVTIQYRDQATQVLERQTVSAGQPQLVGQNNRFSNLSSRVPPAFADFNIWLVLPEVTDRLISRTTLWLKSSENTIQKPLRELVKEQLIEFNSEGQTRIHVGALLPQGPGAYTLQLRQSLKPLLPSPLQFSVLPGIKIRSPDPLPVYSPSNLPSCQITGLQEIDVVASDRHSTSQKENSVLVRWHDLRDDCRLQLHLNKQLIPLAWDVQRLFAWLDPEPEQGYLTVEDLKKTVYHVISPRDYASYFKMWLAGDEEFRKVDFDTRGKYANVIGNDALYDMIRQQRGTRQGVFVGVYEHKWQLFELHRQPLIKFPRVNYDESPSQCSVTFRCELEQPWEGHFTFRIHSLDRPLSAPRKLSETTRLESIHCLPCMLSPGSHLLEILNEGEPIPLSQSWMRFVVGSNRSKFHIQGATALLAYLREENTDVVPRELASDYIQIMLSELEHVGVAGEILTPIRRFHLACLPVSSYENQEHIDAMWPPLAQIVAVNQVTVWEQLYGLLPAWTVLNQPVRMNLGQYSEASVKVYPEAALEKGQTGVGYTNLKIGMDSLHTDRVYVRWQSNFGKVTARFGLPAVPPKEPFAELDELDLWPVYFCKSCGRLVGKRGYITPDDSLFEQHIHGRNNPVFGNILIDTLYEPLPAELWPQRRDEVLQYTYQPSMTIDRTIITSYLEGSDQQSPALDSNPISRQSYCHATWQWLTRYFASNASRRKLNSFTKNQHWQTSLRMMSKRLTEYGYDSKPKVHHEPFFRATGRFLSGFTGVGGRGRRDLIGLDRNVVALAFILRAFSYYPSRTKSLIKQVRLNEDDLIEMLDIFWQVCPELFSWSFTWTELFYIHAIS